MYASSHGSGVEALVWIVISQHVFSWALLEKIGNVGAVLVAVPWDSFHVLLSWGHHLLLLVPPPPLAGAAASPKLRSPTKPVWLGPEPLKYLPLPNVYCATPDLVNLIFFHPALSRPLNLRYLLWGVLLSRLLMCFAFIKLLGGLQCLILVSISNT